MCLANFLILFFSLLRWNENFNIYRISDFNWGNNTLYLYLCITSLQRPSHVSHLMSRGPMSDMSSRASLLQKVWLVNRGCVHLEFNLTPLITHDVWWCLSSLPLRCVRLTPSNCGPQAGGQAVTALPPPQTSSGLGRAEAGCESCWPSFCLRLSLEFLYTTKHLHNYSDPQYIMFNCLIEKGHETLLKNYSHCNDSIAIGTSTLTQKNCLFEIFFWMCTQ